MMPLTEPWATAPVRALYLHIACCRRRCHYCSFVTALLDAETRARYVACLHTELARRFPAGRAHPTLTSVYFGGGTPSLLTGEQVAGLLERLRRHPGLAPDCEVSLEMNPEGIDRARLEAYRDAGVTRLSVGLQAAQDEQLRRLGRVHDRARYLETMALAREVGFASLSSDLMIGLPEQTLAELDESLDVALAAGSQQLSFYSLTIDPGTPFAAAEEAGTLGRLPDEDQERAMYAHCLARAEAAGMRLYELSNAALPGHEGRHNLVYWLGEPYEAVGAGAASFVGGRRRRNRSDIEAWMDGVDRDDWEEDEPLTRADAMREFFWLGLRLTRGVGERRFAARFGEAIPGLLRAAAEALVTEGLLEATTAAYGGGAGWRLTRRGLDLANVAFRRFLAVDGLGD